MKVFLALLENLCEEMFLPTILVVMVVAINGENDSSCKFENGKLGKCMKIEDCALPESGEICGFYGDAVAVCCSGKISHDTPKNAESDPLTRIIGTFGDISRKRCKDMLLRDGPSTAVYNGKLAKAKEFRHMAVLGYGDDEPIEWNCGGTLISDKHVLTAAHCVIREKPSIVRLGDLDLSKSDEDTKPEDVKVKHVHIFDGYKPPAKYHDIAIIELDGRVNRSQYIDVACLDTTRHHNESRYLVMGWGKTEFVGEISKDLQVASVGLFEFGICKASYGSREKLYVNGIVDEYMMCAGGQSDTCLGDSGGPLIVTNEDLSTHFHRSVYNVIGVTSFGKPCGLTADPAIYTRVQYYLPWIERIVWPESYSNDSKIYFFD